MTKIRLATFAILSMILLGACTKSDEQQVVTDSGPSNDLLLHVPADTPYLLANLEPIPEEVIDTFLIRLQPVLDSMQNRLSIARAEMETTAALPQASEEAIEASYHDEMGLALAHALLVELDGKLSRPGLESLGFDLRSNKVVYGMGAFPVVRLGLSDSEVLRATIERVLNNAGIEAPEQNFQGVSFWRVGDEGVDESPISLYLSILDDHLAISLFPAMAESELLPAFLGLQMPVDSDAQARLAELNRTHEYTPHGSGILDIRKLADQFLQAETVAGRALASSGEFDPASLTQECVSEIHEIIDHAPRITMGTTELTTSAVSVQYRVETPASLAGQLMDLVSKIPMVDAHSDRILEFAFGMKFGPVRDFLREKVTAIVDDPYQCEHLADLNSSASESLTQLNQPMPPFVNNFRGLRIRLSEIMVGHDSIPQNARGHLAVHVEQPEMFIGMAQMFIPDLSTLSITPGEPPVRLPESLVPVPGMVAFAALSDNAIGLAVGEGEESGLLPYLDQKSGPDGTFLSASYDVAAYLDYTGKSGDHHQDGMDQHKGDHDAHSQAAREIQEAALKSFSEMADRSHTILRFTSDGFVADNQMTFK
jgi:hypothetical protein